MDNLIIIVGIIGGLASFISYLMNVANVKSKLAHVIYGITLVIVTSFFVNDSAKNNSEKELLSSQLEQIKSIEYQAMNILTNVPQRNDGERRGFMFASLAMLEKYKNEYPDTYAMAREFAISSGVLENKQKDGTERLHQGWALNDGANAMDALMKGLAGGSLPNK